MRNEGADIVQDMTEEVPEWKAKARVAKDAAVEATKAAYEELSEKTIQCSKATDRAIRENPYTSLGIAFGVGALLAFFLTRSGGSESED